ncbi:MAG: hypothetical protein ACI4LX_03665 [Treponema sp.]
MNSSEALEKLLPAFEKFYTVKREGAVCPFDAEAEFCSHTEKYVLVKAARIADIDSNEFVYFSSQKKLDASLLKELSETAWNEGLKKVHAYNGHRNSDVTLIVIAESFSADVKKCAGKIKYSKNYMFGLYGWSNFKLAVLGTENNDAACNWHGREIKKLFVKTGLMSLK